MLVVDCLFVRFVIAIADRFLPDPDVNTMQVLDRYTAILLLLCGSCLNTLSVHSSFIIIVRLSVTVLEC